MKKLNVFTARTKEEIMEHEKGMNKNKRYIGDGVYVNYDGNHIILTAEDGIQVTDTIYLQPQVLEMLGKWVATLEAPMKKPYYQLRAED